MWVRSTHVGARRDFCSRCRVVFQISTYSMGARRNLCLRASSIFGLLLMPPPPRPTIDIAHVRAEAAAVYGWRAVPAETVEQAEREEHLEQQQRERDEGLENEQAEREEHLEQQQRERDEGLENLRLVVAGGAKPGAAGAPHAIPKLIHSDAIDRGNTGGAGGRRTGLIGGPAAASLNRDSGEKWVALGIAQKVEARCFIPGPKAEERALLVAAFEARVQADAEPSCQEATVRAETLRVEAAADFDRLGASRATTVAGIHRHSDFDYEQLSVRGAIACLGSDATAEFMQLATDDFRSNGGDDVRFDQLLAEARSALSVRGAIACLGSDAKAEFMQLATDGFRSNGGDDVRFDQLLAEARSARSDRGATACLSEAARARFDALVGDDGALKPGADEGLHQRLVAEARSARGSSKGASTHNERKQAEVLASERFLSRGLKLMVKGQQECDVYKDSWTQAKVESDHGATCLVYYPRYQASPPPLNTPVPHTLAVPASAPRRLCTPPHTHTRARGAPCALP